MYLGVCVCATRNTAKNARCEEGEGAKETETVCEISHKLLDRTKVCNKNHNKQVLKQPPHIPSPTPSPLIALSTVDTPLNGERKGYSKRGVASC